MGYGESAKSKRFAALQSLRSIESIRGKNGGPFSKPFRPKTFGLIATLDILLYVFRLQMHRIAVSVTDAQATSVAL